ncbi:siderophore-interacting protein [Nocardioides caeni]|uniref:Siderophore-interacting protein n=1 Tax=Nocardioides caeni TaxID=574700 RepID=A0A4S8MZJ0_9ACTN|nr:siderophore-interacting protein [Nocardioides caeni]THV08898.1 siderophore-interacting protein [Nocardioides caeni]
MYGEVITTRALSPHLMRVVLGGPGLEQFESTGDADQYVNCFFRPDGAPYEVPFEDDDTRDLPREQRPFPRRITVRRWDDERRELTLDIATHGEVGYAGRWALHAQPGDRLQMRGPAGGYSPHAEADSYLLVGDESALPAIAACAEAVPPGRPTVVVVEVDGAADEIPIESPAALEVHWVHRSDASGDPDRLLADAVAALPRAAGVVSAFVHGEAAATRAVRRVLLGEHRVDEEHLSCSPYWRRGLDDEAWRSVKAAWGREVAAETFPPPPAAPPTEGTTR